MVDCSVAVFGKSNAAFNVWDMLGSGVENDLDVVVGHEVGERFEFWIHVQMSDGKTGGVVDAKGLVKGVAK